LLFDQSCLNTLEKTGIKNYEPFVIKSKHDFAKFDENNYEDFYQAQLQERKQFNYPPFSRLIQLTIKHKDIKNPACG
jgi:hypothetical protein